MGNGLRVLSTLLAFLLATAALSIVPCAAGNKTGQCATSNEVTRPDPPKRGTVTIELFLAPEYELLPETGGTRLSLDGKVEWEYVPSGQVDLTVGLESWSWWLQPMTFAVQGIGSATFELTVDTDLYGEGRFTKKVSVDGSFTPSDAVVSWPTDVDPFSGDITVVVRYQDVMEGGKEGGDGWGSDNPVGYAMEDTPWVMIIIGLSLFASLVAYLVITSRGKEEDEPEVAGDGTGT